jgi:DNA-binding winged helix-turn-helix (wHTH) protein/TolB-like protein
MTSELQGQRIELAKEGNFRLGALIVRPSTREIETNGTVETLQPRIMQVLIALVRRHGQVVSRDQLIEQCWDGRVVGDDALNRCVQQLRKLGESSGGFRLETVTKVGYRLITDDVTPASLAKTDARGPANFESQIEVARPTETSIAFRPRWTKPLAATLVALALTTVLVFGARTGRPIAGRIAYFGVDAPRDDKEATAVATATSIDILNTFVALQRDVAASTATDGVPVGDRVERALKLKAQYVVSGTASRQGDAMSVSIRVEDAKSRTALWSEAFEGGATKPAAIASRVASLLNDRLACVIRMRASLKTDDMRIVSLFPKACESIRSSSPSSVERWSRLVELSPNSAWVLSNQSTALLNAIADAPAGRVDSLRQRAHDALRRAERIDASDPDLRLALVSEARDRNATHLETEQLFLKGLSLAEHGANLNGNYAGFLKAVGRMKEANRFARRSVTLDPLSGPKLMGLADSLVSVKEPAEAERIFAQLHARYPNEGEWQAHVVAALFHGVGDVEIIVNAPPPSVSRQSIACVEDIVRLVRLATKESSSQAVGRVADCRSKGALQPTPADHLRALLGDFEFLFAGEEGASGFLFNRPYPVVLVLSRIMFDQRLAHLRSDSRFASLTEKLGLFAYWRDSKRLPDFCLVEQAPVCVQLADREIAR